MPKLALIRIHDHTHRTYVPNYSLLINDARECNDLYLMRLGHLASAWVCYLSLCEIAVFELYKLHPV